MFLQAPSSPPGSAPGIAAVVWGSERSEGAQGSGSRSVRRNLVVISTFSLVVLVYEFGGST